VYIRILIVCSQNEQFYFYTRWGRVRAKNQQENVRSDAIKLFKNKFADKTHQEWDNRENFTSSPGKYMLINIATNELNPNSVNNEIQRLNARNSLIANKTQTIKTKLDGRVFHILSQIFDMTKMQKTLK